MNSNSVTSAGSIRRSSAVIAPIAFIGVCLTAFVVVTSPTQGWAGVLVGGVFGATIAVGAALFCAINIAAGARWWWPARHAAIRVARMLPVPAIALLLLVGFVLGAHVLYEWAHHEIHGKAGWLNTKFFALRSIGILLLWFVFISAMARRLRAAAPSQGLVRTGIGFLIVFGVTISVAFWDWTMSLEPHWFSTMQGVYGFAGAFQVGIAAIALMAIEDRMDDKVIHDLASLLFAFSLFWGYIWFCEGMLIWYANIPEETVHYAARFEGGWTMLFWLNPIVNLVIPVVALMSRHAKRSRFVVGQIAMLVIAGHFLDVLTLVGPSIKDDAGVGVTVYSMTPLAAIGATMAVGGGMLLWRRRVR